ncbi:MAG: UDP-N-acetylglucosamine 2-epimerase (non-hydrolyzing) [Deltaproteobacteria bacterium]|nr:UDP-N-acetylglucosamine 2-epimerase (non-hydrolyzing) [Deltaproteobacteria bacterium]
MKIVTIVGARPQFIKAAPVSKALQQAGHQEFILHTGQHYDYQMSRIFFDELGIPEPKANLEIGSGPHGWQTGHMLTRIEEVLVAENPSWVLVYGDTNSTLAGALAAAKLHIPVAHVEAGLRSFNRHMPEEINRVLTDHISSLLFCPTETAARNLAQEGITTGVLLVGDVMYDALVHNLRIAEMRSTILEQLGLRPHDYLLATVHRAESTDHDENLQKLLRAFVEFAQSGQTVVFPVHPRTRKRLNALNMICHPRLLRIDPVSYLDMLALEKQAKVILTDSGGVQKEACWLGVPCVTLRTETEWVETVASGWNVLVGCDPDRIVEAVQRSRPIGQPPPLYGDGHAAARIVCSLQRVVSNISNN